MLPHYPRNPSPARNLSQQFNGDASPFTDDPALTSQFDTGSGYGLSISSMFGTRLSGELAVFRLSSGGEVRRSGARVLDLGDLDSADLRSEGLAPIEVEDKTTGAIGAGMIVALSPRWGIVVDARYLPFDLTARAGGEKATADLNPFIVSVGVRIGR